MSPSHYRFDLRNSLFSETFCYAIENIPWYRRNLVNVPQGLDISKLDHLPALSKETVIRYYDDFVNPNLVTAAIQHTSGTTQNSFILQRSAEELRFTYDFFKEVEGCDLDTAVNEPTPAEGDGRFIVTLGRNAHGDPILRPYKQKQLTVDLSVSSWRPHLPEIFGDQRTIFSFLGERCDLVGPAHQIFFLTTILSDDKFEFAKSKVQSITCSGEYLSETKRRWLESIWGVSVRDDFSICEVSGYAAKCDICSFYHYEPIVLPEALDPVSLKTKQEGIGLLTVTSLYPFSQKMPFMQYLTGDLVEISRDTCEVDYFGFKPKGRVKQSIVEVINGISIIVPAADVIEVLDQFPDVAHVTTGHQYRELSTRYDVGYPLARLTFEKERRSARLDVRLRYSPDFFSQQRDDLAQRIESMLVERCVGLQLLKEELHGNFSVSLMGPPKDQNEANQWSYRISQP